MVERDGGGGVFVDLEFLFDVDAVAGAEGRGDCLGRGEGEVEGRG